MKRLHPVTPDGRYFVASGVLWRKTSPHLPDGERRHWVKALMEARRAVRFAKTGADLKAARAAVDKAKVALGERGPVWWDDGAPDYNRLKPCDTPYAEWWAETKARLPASYWAR